ncbi:MAG: ABC transporter substrate-binding protein, partial [Proteobacteria bacterium]|nr:ABC transporter substrate-binding protein [Pseudomonadota bacterium]
MNLFKNIVIILFLCVVASTTQAEQEDPGKIVKKTIDRVLAVLRDDELNENKKKKIIFNLVKDRINFKEMSRRVLASNWKVASEEQKTQFILNFQEILLNTYWSRIKRYAGERVEYISVSFDNDDYATVDTIIVRDKNNIEIPISYRMKRFVNIWFAYDFMVERLSLVQSYRNEYRAITKNVGIAGLL